MADTPLSNYDRYIGEFNELHEVLKNKTSNQEKNFGRLLYKAKDKNDKTVNNYFERLDFHREFRNIITHSHTSGEPPIAQPSDEIIAELVDLRNKIEHPKKVEDFFKRDVKHFDYKVSLVEVLDEVNDNHYSQFPVFRGEELIGLITENGISQFLSHSMKDGVISIEDVTIDEVFNLEEAKDSYSVVNSETLLIDIRESFRENLDNGITLFAILVSKNGDNIEKPSDIMGIITPWDIPQVLKNI